MKLIKSASFGTVQCDVYQDGTDFFMTRKQIGTALDYSDPARAIGKLHARHKDRLDRFSVVVNVKGADGKSNDTRLYSAKGVFEILRHSRQPKANAFWDGIYELLDRLSKGDLALVSKSGDRQTYLEALRARIALEEHKLPPQHSAEY